MNGTGAGGRTVIDCLMHKLPSSRKYYHVCLMVPDTGIPFINYQQVSSFVGTKKPIKTLYFVDLLFADKKHDTNEKFAFSIYSIDKTITFLPPDETIMNEWLTKIRELHSNLYPEFKRYDSIFEANLLDKDLARTMKIQGHYRLALCKESLDLIPVLTLHDQQQNINSKTTTTIATTPTTISASHTETNLPNIHQSNFTYLQNRHHTTNINQPQLHIHHHHLPQHLPSHQRFCKRHPLLASKTIELIWRNIRRCGHTDSNFYIELGRQSQIGEGGLWMSLNKKSTARQLHELSLAAMKYASTIEDQFLYKAPRSRSGSSSDTAHRSQQSRSSSLVCLNSELTLSSSAAPSNLASCTTIVAANAITDNFNMKNSNNNIEEDSGYLPMA